MCARCSRSRSFGAKFAAESLSVLPGCRASCTTIPTSKGNLQDSNWQLICDP